MAPTMEPRPNYGSDIAGARDDLKVIAQELTEKGEIGLAAKIEGIIEGKIITDHLSEDVSIIEGDKRPDPKRDLARITVIERHGKNGNIANGMVRGFNIQKGAIGSTVCHDHHNIAVVGVDYADMAVAANRLAEIEGGFVVVSDGQVLAELALPEFDSFE